jgi:hypothetical protein
MLVARSPISERPSQDLRELAIAIYSLYNNSYYKTAGHQLGFDILRVRIFVEEG